MALLSSSVTACLASNSQPTFSLSQSACSRGRKNYLDAELNTFTHLLPSFCSSHGVSFSIPCYPGVQSQGREHSCDVIDTGEGDDGTQKRDIEDVKLVTSCCVNSQVPHVEPWLSVKASPESRIHASTLRMYKKSFNTLHGFCPDFCPDLQSEGSETSCRKSEPVCRFCIVGVDRFHKKIT